MELQLNTHNTRLCELCARIAYNSYAKILFLFSAMDILVVLCTEYWVQTLYWEWFNFVFLVLLTFIVVRHYIFNFILCYLRCEMWNHFSLSILRRVTVIPLKMNLFPSTLIFLYCTVTKLRQNKIFEAQRSYYSAHAKLIEFHQKWEVNQLMVSSWWFHGISSSVQCVRVYCAHKYFYSFSFFFFNSKSIVVVVSFSFLFLFLFLHIIFYVCIVFREH